ncbi:alpha/beta fold hydrolase [Stenotrophomonas sp. LARHCG68]
MLGFNPTVSRLMNGQEVMIRTEDGAQVAATVWAAAQPRAVVLIQPAVAVTQRLYRQFAQFLAAHGLTAVTYDYRGTGRSRPASLVDYSADMLDWATKDALAVNEWAREHFQGQALLAVGHSLGGHAVGLTLASNLQAAMLIASHAGVSATIRGAWERARVRFVMRILAPVACRIFGYMPNKRLGLGEDVPAGVMLQWARWTRMPGYFFDDPSVAAADRFAAVAIPLAAIGFTDDRWANPTAIELLVRHFTGTHVERWTVAPKDEGLAAIGHFGFFRLGPDSELWNRACSWLISQVGGEVVGEGI